MIVIKTMFHVAALNASIESIRGICRYLIAKQVKRQRIMKVQLLLDRRQINNTKVTNAVGVIGISNSGRRHRVYGRLDGATNTRFTHEHMVRFLGQHKTTGTAQRVKPRLCKAF